ncbi:MAG TPA: hypothetical protein PKH39_03065 [Woeseiaceae bacterium]|nr:hypothetical protein [Woeseiaceae bacterium]
MANDTLCSLMCALALFATVDALADEEMPDMDFLEYLGMWEASDEEWLLLEDDNVADNKKRIEPVPEGEESTETKDES